MEIGFSVQSRIAGFKTYRIIPARNWRGSIIKKWFGFLDHSKNFVPERNGTVQTCTSAIRSVRFGLNLVAKKKEEIFSQFHKTWQGFQ